MNPTNTVRLIAAWLTVSACGIAAAQTGIVVSLPADIRSTQPGGNRDNTTDAVVLHMVEGLVGYRQNGAVSPLLAQSVDVSKDGLTYTFNLRKGLKFHNGAPLSSADVLWSWKRYLDPKTDWRCLSEIDGRSGYKVTDISAPDPRTFVMRLDKPAPLFLDTMARADCGMSAILHSSSLKTDGSWDKPVGTGPFKLGEWKRGEFIVVNAFKDYQSPPGDKPDGYVGAKRPLVDTVKFLVVPDPSAVKAGLESGAIDAGQITTSDAQELTFGTTFTAKQGGRAGAADPAKPKGGGNINVLISKQASKIVLLLQTRDPLLKNEKLRQAIAASLDIPQIVATSSEGMASVNNSAVYEGSVYSSAVQKTRYQHNAALARKLLHEAGYKGEKIVIQTNKRTNIPSYPVAILAQSMMQAAGINAQIEVLEWATQLDRYNKGNFQISSFSYSSRLDPSLSYEQFAGDKDKEPRKVWDDPQALKLIDASFAETEPRKRQALFDQLHTLMLKQAPLIILHNGIETWAARKRITGFSVWEGKARAWNTQVLQ